MRIEQQSDWVIIHCEQHIDSTLLAVQRDMLAEALTYKKNIQIEAEQLSRISTAGLQLILNFCNAVRQHNLSWQWGKVSETFLKTSTLVGIGNLLALQRSETL